MIIERGQSSISACRGSTTTRWIGVLSLLLGCESSTFVDCPSFERESCLETDACRYRLYGDGSGECRNVCDVLEEDPCPAGFSCTFVTYYDPELDGQMPGPQTDLCVDD